LILLVLAQWCRSLRWHHDGGAGTVNASGEFDRVPRLPPPSCCPQVAIFHMRPGTDDPVIPLLGELCGQNAGTGPGGGEIGDQT